MDSLEVIIVELVEDVTVLWLWSARIQSSFLELSPDGISFTLLSLEFFGYFGVKFLIESHILVIGSLVSLLLDGQEFIEIVLVLINLSLDLVDLPVNAKH